MLTQFISEKMQAERKPDLSKSCSTILWILCSGPERKKQTDENANHPLFSSPISDKTSKICIWKTRYPYEKNQPFLQKFFAETVIST